MRGGRFLETLRRGRWPAALLLATFLLHPALNLLASAPTPAERALLADLATSICTPSGHSDAQPAGQDRHHDPDCALRGFACTMAGACAPAQIPDLLVAALPFGSDRHAVPPAFEPALPGLHLHPSDVGSRAPPARA